MQRDETDFERARPHESAGLSLAQQQGRHARLERDLADAFNAIPWNQPRVQRIVNELAALEELIAVGVPSSL